MSWDCQLPVAEDDAEAQARVCVRRSKSSGRQLWASIVAELLASLAVRWSERKVDFHAIVAHEMSDVSILSRFIRQRESEREREIDTSQ